MSAFLEKLAQWAEAERQTTKRRRKETLAAFLAVREDVKAASAAGYALKTIWEHMHEIGRVSYRYETFLRHVRRHITNAPVERSSQLLPVNPVPRRKVGNESKPNESGVPPRAEVAPVGRFNFDPTPRKEDLL